MMASHIPTDFDFWCSMVGRWHRSVFGEHEPLDHVRAIAQKAKEEAGELFDNPGSRGEVADLFICALAAADRLGMDPLEAIADKLEILKARGATQLERDQERGIVQASEMTGRKWGVWITHRGAKDGAWMTEWPNCAKPWTGTESEAAAKCADRRFHYPLIGYEVREIETGEL